MTRADRVRVGCLVPVAPGEAFELFTRHISRWWLPGPRFGFTAGGGGALRFEGGADGRLLAVRGDGGEPFVVGRVLAWEPGARLVFEWRLGNFAPGEHTEVEVRFQPAPGGTWVQLEHRGLASLPPDHPVRHGQPDGVFSERLARWWGELLGSLRGLASPPGNPIDPA